MCIFSCFNSAEIGLHLTTNFVHNVVLFPSTSKNLLLDYGAPCNRWHHRVNKTGIDGILDREVFMTYTPFLVSTHTV